MRYISAPQRSQTVGASAAGGRARLDFTEVVAATAGAEDAPRLFFESASDMGELCHGLPTDAQLASFA